MALKEFFETHKKGSFHSQLGVPKSEKIPVELLRRIHKAYIGEKVFNPEHITKAKKFIPVTALMKKKARFLLNLRHAHESSGFSPQEETRSWN